MILMILDFSFRWKGCLSRSGQVLAEAGGLCAGVV